MLKFSKLQTFFTFGLVLLGVLFAAPNFLNEGQRESLPGFVPSGIINLGLDLQGGSYLLLKVDTDKVVNDRLSAVGKDMRQQFRRNRAANREPITTRSIRTDNENGVVRIVLRKPEQLEEAIKRARAATRVTGIAAGPQTYRVDGSGNEVTITLEEAARREYGLEAVRDSIEVVRRRIDPAGNKEVSIQPQGTDRIVVQVPGDDDPEALKEIINRTGQLTFHAADLSIQPPIVQDWDAIAKNEDTGCREVGGLPPGRILRRLSNEEEGSQILLVEDAIINGSEVQDASSGVNNDGGGFQINFTFDSSGARKFAKYTRENIGQIFAIVLDCEVISAPNIQSAITGGQGRITGDFSAEEAVRISTLIRSGALPAPLQTIEQRSVSASLGKDSIEAGKKAVIIGFIAVIFYMFISYGRFGLYANIALIANIVLIAGALSLFGSTLTLPGIAGIVLTIGMAVDANVLIFERIREELKNGKGPIQAVEIGFERARSAIIDANITTFIAAFIMFFMGAGPVSGFAVTLAIGVVTSVFSAYVLTRFFVGRYLLNKRPETIKL